MFTVLEANRGRTDNQSKSVKTVTNNDLKRFWRSEYSIKIARNIMEEMLALISPDTLS